MIQTFTQSIPQRAFYWLLLWLFLAAPLALAQPILVKDIFPVPGSPVSLNGKLYFAASSAATGTELYRSDLTGLNMALVKDITPGTGSSTIANLTNVNGTLSFTSGTTLYKSDGTDSGTIPVKTFAETPQYLTNVNGIVFFSGNDGTKGKELWKSNGTSVGTVLVKDINPNAPGSNPHSLSNVNGALYFGADNGSIGSELWKSNGTDAGTVLMKDIYPGTSTNPDSPGPNSSFPYGMTGYNGKVYFGADDGIHGTEFWVTDGTAAGTALVKDMLDYSSDEEATTWSSYPGSFRVMDNILYFIANVAPQQVERLFSSDGTAEGTIDIGGAIPAKYNSSASMAPSAYVNDALYYGTSSYGTLVGYVIKLNKHDRSGDSVVKDFSLDETSISYMSKLGEGICFVVGGEIWKSDGTAKGTAKITDDFISPSNLFSIGNVLYFTSSYGTGTNTLWKYDLNTPPPIAIRINSGGPDHTNQVYRDFYGYYPTDFFVADTYFYGGNVSTLPGDTYNTYIENTDDPTLYMSQRWGAFSYNVPVQKGRYQVILHFAETYWGYRKTGGVGSRKFNVDMEGSRKLTEYDIFAKAGGAMKAIKETFQVDVSDGTLNIAFVKGTADNPNVSAIEIIPVSPINKAPVLAQIGDKSIEVNKTLTFTASATDPDGNAVTYSLVQPLYGAPFPTGATINPTTGVFSWTPSQQGVYSVGVKVTDNGNPSFPSQQDVNICVSPRTDLPVIGSTVCNVTGSITGLSGTVTIKNSEVGVYYALMASEYPELSSEAIAGNGGNLVFTITFSGQSYDLTTFNFNPKVYGCSENTYLQSAQISFVPPPASPVAAGKTVSSGQTATLTASSSQTGVSTYRWYSAATGGTLLYTGASFTTPALTATTSYYVAAVSSNCESARTKVTVTVSGKGAVTVFRINAGGSGFSTIDARRFTGDAYFSGGVLSTTTSKDIAGTADDYLYQPGRHGTSFSYNFPTGNGNYDVVLHFAETYWGNTGPGGIGSRKFHVNMEGERKLTDYDIFAKAGGALRVAQETFRVTVNDGTLNIAFLKGAADNPAIKAIEVMPAGSALTINSGGDVFTAGSGKKFSADVYYAGGSLSSISSGDILNTTDDALYRNARFGPGFSYGLPSGNGTFDVVLHFTETYWGSRVSGGVGSRRFNLYLENTKRLSDYDIFSKAGGAMRAVKETIRVSVSDGVLNLYFAKGSADNPIVSAIEVIPVTSSARIAAEEFTIEEWQVNLYPNPVQDKLTVQLPFSVDQVKATTVTDATSTDRLLNAHKVKGQDQLEIGVESLKKGLYFLRIDTGEGYQIKKFVKQ